MTDTELAEIEKRANAATAGEWTVERIDREDGGVRLVERRLVGTRPGNLHPFIETNAPPGTFEGNRADADAEFIAHARSDVPALVAEVRRLRARLAHLDDIMGAMAPGLR